jgi:hypothetical protein
MGAEPGGVIRPGEERGTGGVFDTGGARYPDESDGSRLGSERYQTGSDGTRSSTDRPSLQPELEAEEPDFFSTLARTAARKERDEERRAPGTWMPGHEDLDRDPAPGDGTDFGTDGPEREYTSRQLGLRLRPKHYDRLVDAARLYGVRPTTMARMMIVRGTNAIHDAELRARARELKESGSE